LPRSRIATSDASLPTTSPSASIITHFLSTSAGLAEYVFIFASYGVTPRNPGTLAGYLSAAPCKVNTGKLYFVLISKV
jgi:hypothetical protein